MNSMPATEDRTPEVSTGFVERTAPHWRITPVRFVIGTLALGAMFWGGPVPLVILQVPGLLLASALIKGIVLVMPDKALVFTDDSGNYGGTLGTPGLYWVTRALKRHAAVSLKPHRLTDLSFIARRRDGSCVPYLVTGRWRVAEAGRALFAVDNYQLFVREQFRLALSNRDREGRDPLAIRKALALEFARRCALGGLVVDTVNVMEVQWSEEDV